MRGTVPPAKKEECEVGVPWFFRVPARSRVGISLTTVGRTHVECFGQVGVICFIIGCIDQYR